MIAFLLSIGLSILAWCGYFIITGIMSLHDRLDMLERIIEQAVIEVKGDRHDER